MKTHTTWDSFDKPVVYHIYDWTLCPNTHANSPRHDPIRVGHKFRRPLRQHS